jgi:hypothetical protein
MWVREKMRPGKTTGRADKLGRAAQSIEPGLSGHQSSEPGYGLSRTAYEYWIVKIAA